MSGDLARLLLAAQPGPELVFGAYVTAWNATTYANTVTTGAATWTNLAVVNPASVAIGPVLMLSTPGGPVVIGRLFKAT